MKIKSLAIFLTSICMSNCVQAQTNMIGWYMGLNDGITKFSLVSTRTFTLDGFNLLHPIWEPRGNNFSASIGYDFYHMCQPMAPIPVRVEVAGTYYPRQAHNIEALFSLPTGVDPGFNEFARDEFKAWSVMANAFIDWHTEFPVTPYIGLGFGYGRVWTSHTAYLVGPLADTPTGSETAVTSTESKIRFMWNGIVGVSYFFNPMVSILMQASYTDLGQFSFTTPSSELYRARHVGAYSADVGIRFSFC